MKIRIFLLIMCISMVMTSCWMVSDNSGTTPTGNRPSYSSTTVKPDPKHDDNDNNGICDNCGGAFVDSRCMGAKCAEDGEHVWGEYKSNEYVHWREYICGHEWPDIDEEHMDANEDGVCDACGYIMTK